MTRLTVSGMALPSDSFAQARYIDSGAATDNSQTYSGNGLAQVPHIEHIGTKYDGTHITVSGTNMTGAFYPPDFHWNAQGSFTSGTVRSVNSPDYGGIIKRVFSFLCGLAFALSAQAACLEVTAPRIRSKLAP
jgi:hypothetical protein